MNQTFLLNTGLRMPIIGCKFLGTFKGKFLLNIFVVGTYKSTPEELAKAIPTAIETDYRLFGKF